MTAHSAPFLAAVTTVEQTIVELALRHLGDALSQASDEVWSCPVSFTPDLGKLAGTTSGAVVVTSLLLPLADVDRPWAEIEQELHDTYSALCAGGDPVMICTILRHVDATEDFERAARIRRRIRKLNLLATELSRQHGAFVIDIDRVLADVGARHLQTDFRLGGSVAAELAAKTIALCIATNALDAVASVKVQDAARTILAAHQVTVGMTTDQMMTNVMALGKGRRRQHVATLTDEVEENHVGWLVRQVLKGRIGLPEAAAKLAGAMRRRGARESAWLLITGVSRMLRPAEAGRR